MTSLERRPPRVCVYIDNREDDLWAALEPWWSPENTASLQDGWFVEKRMLEVGDIAFVLKSSDEKEVVVLERKTADDLGASQRDGRYREQRARLLAKKGTGITVGYVLEASMPWSSTLTRTWCRGTFKEVHLQQAILRLQMHYGISVLQASSLKETVMWIRRIATGIVDDPSAYTNGLATDAESAAAAYTQAIHVKKSANMAVGGRHLTTVLRTVPGVGTAAADAVVRHVGDTGFPGFFALSVDELATLPMNTEGQKVKRRLGSAVASKLWHAFHSSSASDALPTPTG